MSEESYLTGRCPQCGEALRVPERLREFSCMFCGAKLTPDALVDELPPPAPEGDAGALMEQVRARLPRCVTGYPGLHRKINRREYEPAFEAYERDCRGVFETLDLACRIEPERKTERLAALIGEFLDQLEAAWRREPKAKYNAARDDAKMTIAIFLVPMVGRLRLSVSDEFCQTLQARWVERYPKSPFYVGNYDAIIEGFHRRFRFCFITTALCRELGKPDDCAELTAFRAFRDGYLRREPDGPALIAEYYDIAPGLVACLDLCEGRAGYRELRERYLGPCYEDLLAGREADCKARYVEMVRALERRYLS